MNLQNHGESNFQPRESLGPKRQMRKMQVKSLLQVIHEVLIQKNVNVKQFLQIINLHLNQELP